MGKLQVDDGLVVFVAVVRCDELQLPGQVALTDDFKTLDVFRAIFFCLPTRRRRCRGCLGFGFAYPGGFGLKRILIKMERKVIEGLAGQIVIGEYLGGVDGVRVASYFASIS